MPGQIIIGKEWFDEMANGNENDRKEAIRKLIHENLHLILSKPENRHFIEDIRGIFNQFKNKNNDKNAEVYLFNTIKEHELKYWYDIKRDKDGNVIDRTKLEEINENGLEEFLVESLTSKILANALNNIKSDNPKKSLFDKIIDFLLQLFDWNGLVDVNKDSLYEEDDSLLELY